MFVFNNKETNGMCDVDNSTDNESSDDWQCFLLPLGPTFEEEVEYPRMSSWPIFPFYCNVSLSDRWSAFEALLLNETTKMVTYNATISLLPFYHHLDNDVMNQTRSSSLSSFSAYIAGDGSDLSPSGKNDGSLRSTWDLRLASWMLRPDAKDDELEFSMFQEGFAHLAPAHQQSSPTTIPSIMQGLSQAKINLELLHSLYPILNAQLVDGGLLDALECIETPVQSILACMESRGIAFLPDRLKKIEAQIETRISELESQSRSITKDSSFLLSSPQQVSHFLFDVLSLKMPAGLISKTTAGSSHRSTSEEALQAIKDELTSRTGSSPPIIDMILEFRQLNKFLTSFVRPLPKICRRVVKVPKELAKKSKRTTLRRIYPQWMQTAVRTGRLSCRKPNLQQVPKEGAYGVVPRSAFVTEEGMCLFACDYSQKEVRILAHMSNDETMIALFRDDPTVDIYRQMSSIILNKSADTVTDGERSQFKIITLAILYGMSANQVATQLKISKNNAQQLMADFFRRFRRVKPWMDDLKAYARSKLYVKTISGRKRYLDDINSDDHAKRSQAERQVSAYEQAVHDILYSNLLIHSCV
jgi:DNA polymerase-1